MDALREALRSPDYAHPYQVFDNMDTDGLVCDRDSDMPTPRSALIAELRAVASPDEMLERTRKFCHRHQQEGPADPTAQAAILGCVQALDKVAEALWDENSQGGPDHVKTHLRQVLGIQDEAERLTVQKQQFADGPLTRYQAWAFHDVPHDDPFATLGLRRVDVVDRLGLGAYEQTTDELVCWTCRLPSGTTAHTPTAWDADADPNWSVFWRPGGRTQPLHESATEQGLPEVVHNSVERQALVKPLTPLEVE